MALHSTRRNAFRERGWHADSDSRRTLQIAIRRRSVQTAPGLSQYGSRPNHRLFIAAAKFGRAPGSKGKAPVLPGSFALLVIDERRLRIDSGHMTPPFRLTLLLFVSLGWTAEAPAAAKDTGPDHYRARRASLARIHALEGPPQRYGRFEVRVT
jgi:hypothetical protein